MKRLFAALLFLITSTANFSYAQQFVDKVKFFSDTSMVNATLTVNLKKLLSNKNKDGVTFPATFACKLDDGFNINDPITVELRGHFRKGYCYYPPDKTYF